MGSKGDPFDNAVAETVHGLYKPELMNCRGPWRGAIHIEVAAPEWVEWWNQRRLPAAAGDRPPAEYQRLWWEPEEEVA